ncbi:MAG: hypothetical protein LBK47_07170 [Prevotellaceae bacterium]|jgi:hypothetical protein|nr:hypothetical protein [Prevotellaceae bacterium]
MKKLLTLALSLIVALSAKAIEHRTATAAQAEQFYKTTTCVVLTNDNIILDAFLRDAAQKEWKATPLKFIDMSEFTDMKRSDKYSFLMIAKTVEGKDKMKQAYYYMSLLLGDKDVHENINNMPELAFIPMACPNADGEVGSTMMAPLVRFAQKNVENIKNKLMEKQLLMDFQNRLTVYNYNTDKLKGKTIYVNRNDISTEVTSEKLAGMFGDNLKVVNDDELAAIVNAGDANNVVALTIYPVETGKGLFAYKMVVGLDGELYYYYHEKRAKNFKLNANDFDMLMRPYKK